MAFDTTMLLLAYNQISSIEKAIDAAFRQIGEPIEILLSDDGSSDGTVDKMREMAERYVGPHLVRVRQSPGNQGLVRHLENAVAESQGRLIVVAAGDDFSHPQRVQRLRDVWRGAGSGTCFLYSDVQPVGADGQHISFVDERVHPGPHRLGTMAHGQIATLGATAAFTRDVIEHFPGMSATVRHEDRVIPFRATLLGGDVLFVDEKLIDYTVVGGVSRGKPISKADYLTRYTKEINSRTIEDAYQRLADAQHAKASEETLHACRSAIIGQGALIALSGATGMGVEIAALRGLAQGAKLLPLARHYLKMRLPVGKTRY